MKCPNCGGVVGDTSPACVDCGHSLGKVETCEECKGPIPRTEKVCPRCSPKILQYMGIKAPPKKKKEEPKRPERPKPPLLNAPKPPTPKPRPNTDDVLEGETELRKEPYTPPPKRDRRIQPPPVLFDRTGPDALSERKAEERRVHWGAVLLGILVAGIGAAGAFYYLPKIGLDPKLVAKLPPVINDNLLYIAYGAIGLGLLEIIRGFAHKPRAVRKCKSCRTSVAAFRKPFSFVCEICGKSTGFRAINSVLVLVQLAIVGAVIAGAVMLKTGLGLQ